MRRIALKSLIHDRGKLIASLSGVAFAATLVLSQIGLYVGFLNSSSSVITNARADLWVMPRGTEVIENGDRLSAQSRGLVAAHPCVASVRGLILSFAVSRKNNGVRDAVVVIGFEPSKAALLPWNVRSGLPHDLHAPARVAVDNYDLPKLQVHGDPMGARLEIGNESVYITAVTEGIRSFTLTPYVFAELGLARRLVMMVGDQVNYWMVNLKHGHCRESVRAFVNRHQDLEARTTAEFAAATETYWVKGSGAGTALGFAALLGLVVGVVIVGQTLYAVTKEHQRELATLKAVGATRLEIVGFVAWQAAFLAVVGGAIGTLIAFGVRAGIAKMGLQIALTPGVLTFGCVSILLMCALASLWSVRAVLVLEAAEVFK